jgi:hypothetical protein
MRYPEGLKILVVLTLVVAGCNPFLEDRSAQIRGECPMLSGRSPGVKHPARLGSDRRWQIAAKHLDGAPRPSVGTAGV